MMSIVGQSFQYVSCERVPQRDQLFTAAHKRLYTTRSLKLDNNFPMRTVNGNRQRTTSEYTECVICYELVVGAQAWKPQWTTCMTAGQCVCVECIRGYVISKLSVAEVNANRTISCPCPDSSCPGAITEVEVYHFLSQAGDEKIKNKFIPFCQNVEVATDPCKLWCPNVSCKSVVTFKEGSKKAHCSTCGYHFCAKCGLQHSRLMTCGMVSDKSFRQWRRTTPEGCRRCPKCSIFIEKDHGCPHMNCSSCKYQFCWACMGRWNGGCTSPKVYCSAMTLLGHNVWGESRHIRLVTKSIAAPILLAVGCGVGGTMLGVGAAAGAVTLGGLVALSPVLGGIHVYNNPPTWMRKYMTPNLKVMNITGSSLLVRGVKVMAPWRYDDPNYLETLDKTNGNTFMGYRGRRHNSVFIAYVNDHALLDVSFLLYFIPVGAPQEDIPVRDHELDVRMLQVAFPSNRVPNEGHDDEVSQMLYRKIEAALWVGAAM